MPSLNLDDKPGIFGESADGDAGDDVRCRERAIAQLPQKIKIKSSRHPEGRKMHAGSCRRLTHGADTPPRSNLWKGHAASRHASLLSTFQNTGVAGPSSTPVSDFRHALGARNWPSGT